MRQKLGIVFASLLLVGAILVYLAVDREPGIAPHSASSPTSTEPLTPSAPTNLDPPLPGPQPSSSPTSRAKTSNVTSASTPQLAERRERNRMAPRETPAPATLPPPAAAPSTTSPPVGGSPESEGEAARDLDKITLMLRDYRTRMGENPFGTNAEIMKAVMGENPVRAVLGPPDGQHLNEKGELVDRWGTPYFFHQISASHMEIHSAGPDRVRGTGDDIIQH